MSCEAIRIPFGTMFPYLAQLDTDPLVYKTIVAKTADTPLTLTVTAHGLPASWEAAFADIGYEDLNAKVWPPCDADFFAVTAVDVDTLRFNAIDLARLDGTFADGDIVYRTPISLAGASAVLTIYPLDGTDPLELTCALDNTAKTISVTIDSNDLAIADYTFALLFTDAAGIVTQEDCGNLTIYAPGSECH